MVKSNPKKPKLLSLFFMIGNMTHNPHLSQQVILITGASAGIGSALAQLLARRFGGVRLAITARREDRLEAIAQECRGYGADVLVIRADMRDSTQVGNLARQVIEHWGRVDALVNNAGYGQMGPIELVSPGTALEQLAVNFHAPLVLIQALIPTLREQGGGRIVNISSIAGRMAFPSGGLYSASKFALEALSDALRMELQGFNIQVSVVEPGPVMTEFFQVVREQVETTIPEGERGIYQPSFAKIEAIEARMKMLGWTAEKAAGVIVQALSDRSPRPRYLATTGGSVFVPLMTKVMPTWFTDAFWKRFYGIDQVEREWQKIAKRSP